jgi:hypothetical protein
LRANNFVRAQPGGGCLLVGSDQAANQAQHPGGGTLLVGVGKLFLPTDISSFVSFTLKVFVAASFGSDTPIWQLLH